MYVVAVIAQAVIVCAVVLLVILGIDAYIVVDHAALCTCGTYGIFIASRIAILHGK